MTELPLLLKRLSVDTVVVCGTQDPNCVRATVYDAVSYDFNVILLSDATSSKTNDIHEQNVRDMKNIGVDVMTSDEFIRNVK
jgi:nicotinamidase-related amidase